MERSSSKLKPALCHLQRVAVAPGDTLVRLKWHQNTLIQNPLKVLGTAGSSWVQVEFLAGDAFGCFGGSHTMAPYRLQAVERVPLDMAWVHGRTARGRRRTFDHSNFWFHTGSSVFWMIHELRDLPFFREKVQYGSLVVMSFAGRRSALTSRTRRAPCGSGFRV